MSSYSGDILKEKLEMAQTEKGRPACLLLNAQEWCDLLRLVVTRTTAARISDTETSVAKPKQAPYTPP